MDNTSRRKYGTPIFFLNNIQVITITSIIYWHMINDTLIDHENTHQRILEHYFNILIQTQ